MKDKWRHYATKKGLEQKGYFTEYRHRNPLRQRPKTSRSNCIQQSGKEPEKINTIYIGELNESVREEDANKAYKERRQRIQESNQRRYELEEANISKTQEEKMKKQTKNDRLDEKLSAKHGKESTKKQTFKDRRDESRGSSKKK